LIVVSKFNATGIGRFLDFLSVKVSYSRESVTNCVNIEVAAPVSIIFHNNNLVLIVIVSQIIINNRNYLSFV